MFHTVVRFALGPYLMRQETDASEGQTTTDHQADDLDENTSLLPQNRPVEVRKSTPTSGLRAIARVILQKCRAWLNPALVGALVAM